jgi:NADP+-dependent farnesol dehydrogenase
MEKWIGKVAVVTGASAGIGEAIVKAFAANGIHVVGLARRSEKVEEFARTLGDTSGTIYAHKCDVSDLTSVKEAFKWIEEKFGSISIVVNNAGVAFKAQILGEGDDEVEKINTVINTNFTGLVHCAREAVRLIKKSEDYGMVININSILGHVNPFTPTATLNVYAPTKFAVTAVSEVLRQELIVQGNKKIRVSSLSPGRVRTEMSTPNNVVADEYFANVAVLQCEDIAQAAMFLLQTPTSVNITELTIKPVGEQM